MNTRRNLLASIAAAALLTLSFAAEGRSQSGHATKRAMEGTWRVTTNLGPNRPPDTPESVELLVTFAEGGGYIFTDNETSGHGTWEFAERGRFNATGERFILGSDGQVFAVIHIRAKITLDASQNGLTTEEAVEIRLVPSGTVIYSYTGAVGVGTRIVVEPIE